MNENGKTQRISETDVQRQLAICQEIKKRQNK